jgi:hypothetical protein
MKKKLPEMARAFETYIKENIAKKLGVADPTTIRLDGQEAERNGVRHMREELLNSLLNKYIEEVERQNKEYFETKARELLEMRKQDPLSLIMANLLFKSLNISMEQYIQKLQKSGGTASLIGNKVNNNLNNGDEAASNKENSSLASNAQNKGNNFPLIPF